MAGLTIHSEKLTPALAKELSALCPFGALEETAEGLAVGAGCKMCRLCVKKSSGVITEEETPKPQINKEEWVGVAVFADFAHGRLHPVTLELLGKAQELAAVTGHPVYALLLGSDTQKAVAELLRYGADRVYVYDHPALAEFTIEPYADAFADFIENVKPSSILV
jgi:electron transfer flavoprotein alpha subunit